MPKNKDFKHLVRTRMQKTGESYTAARSQLLRKKAASTATVSKRQDRPRPPALDLSVAPMSDTTIQAKTGRTWLEWVAALDAIEATKMSHSEIAAYVHDTFGVPSWWTQTVTVGYERIRGLRDVGQRRGGGYEVNKSKTVAAPVAMAFHAFTDARTRQRWLGKTALKIRGATASKTVRITWHDGTDVVVYFVAKGPGKTQVTIQHGKLGSRAQAAELRVYWNERLAALAASLGASLGAAPAIRRRSATATKGRSATTTRRRTTTRPRTAKR